MASSSDYRRLSPLPLKRSPVPFIPGYNTIWIRSMGTLMMLAGALIPHVQTRFSATWGSNSPDFAGIAASDEPSSKEFRSLVLEAANGAVGSCGVLERVGPMVRQHFIRYGDVT
jgi:hypothetical protein